MKEMLGSKYDLFSLNESATMDYDGERPGKYCYLKLMHRGSVVDVWLAEHVELKIKVVIKILYLSEFASERERIRAAQRFRKEAQIQAYLEHPLIIRPLDLEVEDDYLLLILPYAPLGTLSAQHAPGQQLPLQTVKMYVGQIGRALQFRDLLITCFTPLGSPPWHRGLSTAKPFPTLVLSKSATQRGPRDFRG